MRQKYNKIIEEIEKVLPCQKGELYYTIERECKITREIKEDKCGNPVVLEHTATIGKKIAENTWHRLSDIVREIENGNIGKRIFLTKEEAEKKFPKYWEDWWGDKPNK